MLGPLSCSASFRSVSLDFFLVCNCIRGRPWTCLMVCGLSRQIWGVMVCI